MNFDKNLQALRKAKKITQEVLAEELSISRQAIGKWESGDACPDAERLIQISEYFGVSIDSLVKGNIEIEPADADSKEVEAGKVEAGVKDDSQVEKRDNSLELYGVSYRNRIIRSTAAFVLILASPFIPGETGNGTIRTFLMFLCIISGIALLIYNHLSKKAGGK